MENMKLFIMIAREVDTSILCWTVGFMEGAHLAIARHHKNGIIHQKNWENDGQLQNPRKKKLNTRKRFLKYHISLIPWFPRAYFYIAWVSRGVLLYFLAGYKMVLFLSHPGHCISPQGAREGGGQGVQLICPRLYI